MGKIVISVIATTGYNDEILSSPALTVVTNDFYRIWTGNGWTPRWVLASTGQRMDDSPLPTHKLRVFNRFPLCFYYSATIS